MPPDLLSDVNLQVSISFGKTILPLREVLKLTTGSVLELDRQTDEYVDVLINDRLIARGEVVVIEGNYGVRIQELIGQRAGESAESANTESQMEDE